MKAGVVLNHPATWFLLTIGALTLLAPLLNIPIDRITQIAIYALYAGGVNLLLGYTGLVSFGASLFFGAGTYAAALFALRLLPNEIIASVFAGLFALLLGLAVGSIALRRRGIYFSLLTLAFSQLAFEIAFRWTAFTGGENGLQNVPRAIFQKVLSFHMFVAISVAIFFYLMWRFVHSPVGRVFQAIRDNEQRAKCIGYDTYRYKLLSFALSSALIGYAGGLLAFLVRGAYANNLSWQHAADALLMAVLGGVHHFLGALWGSIIFIVLQEQLSVLTEHWWLIFAPIIMGFVLLSPDGIHELGQRVFGIRRRTLTRLEVPHRPSQISPFRSSMSNVPSDLPLLSVSGISKKFGSLVTAADISLQVFPRQLHSLIGPNGAGKTTFFNMLSGIVRQDQGRIVLRGVDISRMPVHRRVRNGLSRSFQIISLFQNLTAFETVRIAVQAQSSQRFGFFSNALELTAINESTWSILAAIRLDDKAGEVCSSLSHGDQRLLDLALVLASGGDLLLLDEPLAGLSEADRRVVSSVIVDLARTHAVLMVEHDIDRVMSLSDRITVLHQGKLIADGLPREVANDPAVIAAYIGKSDTDDDIEKVLASASRRVRSGAEPLLILENLRGGYEGSTVLEDINLTVGTGEVVALLGRNGVGKTTTLRAICGAVKAQSGRIVFDNKDIATLPTYAINRLGVGLVPEGRRVFPNLTVAENLKIASRPGGISLSDAYDIFPKLRTLQSSRASNLSGGERQMLAIARVLMFPTKLILLDEPFEGLSPAIVKEVMKAVAGLRERSSVIIVEHNAELVLPFVDRVYVLVNGRVAYEGLAEELAMDEPLQARLLGVTHGEVHEPAG